LGLGVCGGQFGEATCEEFIEGVEDVLEDEAVIHEIDDS
jgi:hypothetical protein